ncbi:MAG: deoxynucleoside kinase, partial [Candidatus Neomarinimicrobiota bacterium]
KTPDLIIYLRASVDTLRTRIKKRSRGFERDISPEYIYMLNLSYDRWIKEEQSRNKVLVIETDQFDVFRDQDKLERILNQIRDICP